MSAFPGQYVKIILALWNRTGSSINIEAHRASHCQCQPGTTGSNGGSCSLCATGKYKESRGTDLCSDCVAGKSSDTEGAVSIDTCATCGAGTYQESQGSSECDKCDPGTYSEALGALSIDTCAQCGPGHTKNCRDHLGATNAMQDHIQRQWVPRP